MIKKIILFSALVGLLTTTSCSKDEPAAPETTTDNSIDAQIAAINALPYSALTPADQKIKLETDANQLLTELNQLSSSSAIDALQNLERLIKINRIDFIVNDSNGVQDLLSVSGAYGIYTWNNIMQVWIKTPSTTELKFIFPAKKTQTVNNTVLSSVATSSNVKIQLTDTRERGYWQFVNGNYTYVLLSPAVFDEFYLPSSVNATLKIDNVDAATITSTAVYSGNKQAPDDSNFKVILNDGYLWDFVGKKGTPNAISNKLSYNGKSLLDFTTNSTANIDQILANNNQPSYIGKANTLIKLMDNFIIVGQNDFETLANDQDVFESSLVRPNYNSSTYYANINAYKNAYSAASVVAYNKNIKMALVSSKDGTKIADIIRKSVIGNIYTNNVVWTSAFGGYWQYSSNPADIKIVQNYDEVLYLRFKDNTDVAFDVYFSSGFSNLETRFQNFINSFN